MVSPLLRNVVQSYALQSMIDKTLVLLSDRQKGLVEGVNGVFPNCPHSYCLRHLEQNMHKEFKQPDLKTFLWKATRATTQPEFDQAIANMRNVNAQAVK